MLRCTSAGVSNCEVPDIRSNTVQRSPSTKISSWKSRATSLEESSRLSFSEIHPENWHGYSTCWFFNCIKRGNICYLYEFQRGKFLVMHENKGVKRRKRSPNLAEKYQVIPMNFSRWALFIWRFLFIFHGFCWPEKTFGILKPTPWIKTWETHPKTSRPRRCAHLARRGGGIAVGCPGAMLGAAVPNTFFRVTNPRTDLQNNAKIWGTVYRELKKNRLYPSISLIWKKDFASAFFSNLWSGALLCWEEISEPDSIPTNIPDVFPPEFLQPFWGLRSVRWS